MFLQPITKEEYEEGLREEGYKEGFKKGFEEGRRATQIENIIRMYCYYYPISQIALALNISADDVREVLLRNDLQF